MNYQMIRFILGRMLLFLAGILGIPFILSLIYGEEKFVILGFAVTIMTLLALGGISSFKTPPKKSLFAREGFLLCALTWLSLSFFGSLPFFISGYIPNIFDAFFETASGFTTTGASIIANVELLPKSLLFWRSFTHLVGGMGVLVFVLAILPPTESDSSSVYLMKAEVPGPVFGKLLSKIKDISRILYIIYLAMTGILIVFLLFGGMNLFDACIHAFGAAGTGGFSNKAGSIAHYNSAYIEYVLGFAMIAFGINFNLYYLLLVKKTWQVFREEEFKWYIGLIIFACTALMAILWGSYVNHWTQLKDVFFTVSTILTTTGYGTVDFTKWPLLAQGILLFLMFAGGCAGSTAGGFKIARVAILFKTLRAEFQRSLNPNRLVNIRINKKSITSTTSNGVLGYFALYVIIFLVLFMCILPDSNSFITAFSAVSATLNNIGPGLDAVGPTSNYAAFNNFSKVMLSFSMILGRLEILPVLLLFSPRAWRRG